VQASIGYEAIDAETFAGWGIDYLKYDNCNVPSNWTDEYIACVPDGSSEESTNGTCTNTTSPPFLNPPGYDWSTSNTSERYRRMRDALAAQNRTILYSLCDWGNADVEEWGNATGNSWRMSGDITPYWYRVAQILNENSFQLNSVNFWGHNDADMLEVGNGNLTYAETRSHFAFWAAMKSPLIIGTDLSNISQANVDILANPTLLAFSQNPVYGGPATPYKWGTNPDWTFNATNPAEYWVGASSNGTLVLLLNTLDDDTRTMAAEWEEIPSLEGGCSYEVVDGWTEDSLGCLPGWNGTVASHDTQVLLVQGEC